MTKTKKDDGGPAYPWGGDVCGGMSLRDYFAARALPGLIALNTDCTPAEIAHDSFLYADAMIAASKEGAGE